MTSAREPGSPLEVGRPYAPGYGLKDAAAGSGLLSWSWVTERMTKARNYWVATASTDGAPHAMPVWGLWLDEAFHFSTGRRSRKGRDLATNPRVVVHLESGDDVVILEGTVEEVTDPRHLARFVDAYFAKYAVRVGTTPEELRDGPAFVLRPDRAFAWLESDYPGGATRWRFGETK